MSHLYKWKGGDTWYIKYYEGGRPRYRSLKTRSKKRAQAMQREIDTPQVKFVVFCAYHAVICS